MPLMNLESLIATHFGDPQKCYGHCEKQASLKYLESGDVLVACFVCPAGYVSKVMAYGTSPTQGRLKAFLAQALAGAMELRDEDLRVATRHSWDLRVPGSDLSAAYWTQNYRRKSEDADRNALFMCQKCASLWVTPLSKSGPLCPRCA